MKLCVRHSTRFAPLTGLPLFWFDFFLLFCYRWHFCVPIAWPKSTNGWLISAFFCNVQYSFFLRALFHSILCTCKWTKKRRIKRFNDRIQLSWCHSCTLSGDMKFYTQLVRPLTTYFIQLEYTFEMKMYHHSVLRFFLVAWIDIRAPNSLAIVWLWACAHIFALSLSIACRLSTNVSVAFLFVLQKIVFIWQIPFLLASFKLERIKRN